MKVVILGDQYRKGLKSKGCPGLLETSKNHCLIQDQYKAVEDKASIIYICGFDKQKLIQFCAKKELSIELVENLYFDKYNEVFGLSYLSKIDDDCLITLGYNFIHPRYLESYNNSVIFSSKSSGSEIGCVVNDKVVEYMNFGLPNPIVNSYYIARKDMDLFFELTHTKTNHNCFLFEIINQMIDRKVQFTNELLNPKYHYEY